MKFSTRIIVLEKLLLMFEIIEAEIKFCAVPLVEILEKMTSRKELDDLLFLNECKNKYSKTLNFSSSWYESIDSCNIGLEKEDKDILFSFGNSLGTTDVSGQINICKLHKKMTEDHLNVARNESRKLSKLHTSLGTMTGIFLAVVLM